MPGKPPIEFPSDKTIKDTKEKYRTTEARRAEAYERLGCTQEDTKKIPQVSHILKKIKGGTKTAIAFLRHSDDEAAKQLFISFESIPSYLAALLPIEAFCFAGGVDSRKICEIIFKIALSHSNQASLMIAATNYPAITKVSVETAKQPLGIKDRENLGKALNFIPIPESMRSIIHVQATATASAQSQAAAIATLPPAEDTIRRLSSRFSERFIGTEAPKVAALTSGEEQEEDFIPANARELVPVELDDTQEE